MLLLQHMRQGRGAVMLFRRPAFASPVKAINYPFVVSAPYFEGNFTTNESGRFAELSFEVQTTGYYVIQTFGIFDWEGCSVKVTIY